MSKAYIIAKGLSQMDGWVVSVTATWPLEQRLSRPPPPAPIRRAFGWDGRAARRAIRDSECGGVGVGAFAPYTVWRQAVRA